MASNGDPLKSPRFSASFQLSVGNKVYGQFNAAGFLRDGRDGKKEVSGPLTRRITAEEAAKCTVVPNRAKPGEVTRREFNGKEYYELMVDPFAHFELDKATKAMSVVFKQNGANHKLVFTALSGDKYSNATMAIYKPAGDGWDLVTAKGHAKVRHGRDAIGAPEVPVPPKQSGAAAVPDDADIPF